MRERATSRCMKAPKLLEIAFNDMVVLSLVSTASVGSIDKTSGGLVFGQSFAINEDEGSANCSGWYLVNQLMMIVGLGEVKLSVTPSAAAAADDDDVTDSATVLTL